MPCDLQAVPMIAAFVEEDSCGAPSLGAAEGPRVCGCEEEDATQLAAISRPANPFADQLREGQLVTLPAAK